MPDEFTSIVSFPGFTDIVFFSSNIPFPIAYFCNEVVGFTFNFPSESISK